MDSKLAESPRRRQELSILTSYSESVFLLVSQLSIGRKPIELLPSPGGGGFVLQCEWPYFQLPFQKVLVPVSELLQSCGASRMGKFWSEPSPVFDVDFDSQASIQQMIGSLESGLVYEGMESIILPLIQMAWKETNPDAKLEWKLDISLELLQVLPNVDTKDAIIQRVSSSNSSICVHLWNERKVFDIGALLRWYRSKPLGGIAGGKDQMLVEGFPVITLHNASIHCFSNSFPTFIHSNAVLLLEKLLLASRCCGTPPPYLIELFVVGLLPQCFMMGAEN